MGNVYLGPLIRSVTLFAKMFGRIRSEVAFIETERYTQTLLPVVAEKNIGCIREE